MLDGYALRKAFHSGTPNQRVALADVTPASRPAILQS